MRNLCFILVISVFLTLSGCGTSRDYTPPTEASGEQIFSTACTECHKPLNANVAMILSEKVSNKEEIIRKVQSGSMRMPGFKNIQGEAADRLAEYILANSQVK